MECVAGFWLAAGVHGQSSAGPVQRRLSRAIESGRVPAALAPYSGRNGTIWPLTRGFYAQRDARPAWTSAAGDARQVRELLGALEQAEAQGLDAGDYPLVVLRTLLDAPGTDPDTLAELDLLATAAFFRFANDVAVGRVVPSVVDTVWAAASRSLDLVERLGVALDSGRVRASLLELAPSQPGAARLREALARYRDIAARGGWPEVPPGPPLTLDAAGSRVEILRRRLAATGDLTRAGGGVFDSAVREAVERVQSRYGLNVDAIVGPATLAALNVPVAERIRQLKLNLERWRWLPPGLGDRYITVNSASFTLEVVEAGCTVLLAPVISGRVDWPTPIVSGMLTDVAFNPRWNIPRSIAVRELLPIVHRDPAYFVRQGIHVMSDVTENAIELDPMSIRWAAVQASTFRYRLWQEPGPRNPLGRIRFGVSTRFGVKLHDTPNRASFALRSRVFSHGCVRVAGAQELAVHVLRGRTGWGPSAEDSVAAALARPLERRIEVPQPIPVYLTYWTAWVDEDGVTQFRPDVYGWDAKLARALRGIGRDHQESAASGPDR